MAVLLNGTNGLIQAYDYQTPTTGFSYTFAAGTQTLVMNPAGTLATGTITMPASPSDGMTITFSTTQQITALTLSGNTGQTIVGGPTQLIPNQPLAFIYRLTSTTWFPIAGGAGRATSVVSGTSVASTSGTSIDFTSIPSWVKRVTVMLNNVSTTSASNFQIQLGYSGGVESTGYTNFSGWMNSSSANGCSFVTTGFVMPNWSAAATHSGSVTFTNLSGNTWACQGVSASASGGGSVGGSKTLTGTLDRVRITTLSGTDTFDAGSINILYE